jgi:hypothetical protein
MLPALLSVALSLSGLASRAAAQDKHRQPTAAKHPKSSTSKHKAEKSAPAANDATPKPAPAGKHEEVAPTAKSPTPPPVADAEENVHKEGGTEVKTLEFGGLDIEGQLKTPQMLYFLNRLRAEFERPQLPHRSFIPELERTTKENVF